VFATWHESLNAAADRTLAAAIADRAWMKADAETAKGSEPLGSSPSPASRLRTAIQRVQQLRPTVEPILREERVPAELSAVMLVESGGLLSVYSPKGARGAWQFMPDTARRYGLQVSTDRDDRSDLLRSTRAAARYLRDLREQFGNWELALAAYNAGEQRVDRAIGRAGSRRFSDISARLPLETRNYVPAVLEAIAALSGEPHPLFRQPRSTSRPVYATTTAPAPLGSPTNK
jgi:hypothetical protein